MLTIRFSYSVDGAAVENHDLKLSDPVKSAGAKGAYECVVTLAPHPGLPVFGVTPFDAVQNALTVAKGFTEGQRISGLTWG